MQSFEKCLNRLGVVCLLLRGDETLPRINLRRQWPSREITNGESNHFMD